MAASRSGGAESPRASTTSVVDWIAISPKSAAMRRLGRSFSARKIEAQLMSIPSVRS